MPAVSAGWKCFPCLFPTFLGCLPVNTEVPGTGFVHAQAPFIKKHSIQGSNGGFGLAVICHLNTWAPRGQTPVLQYHFTWKTLSAMAGITWCNFYFRLFPGRSPQAVEFLSHLLRHIPASC
jgi:hypothetical protein